MIAGLRRRHRWMAPLFLGLAPAFVFVAAVAGRWPAPLRAEIPQDIVGREEWSAPSIPLGRIWEDLGFAASLQRSGDRARLIVQIVDPPLKPDLLLFWMSASAEIRTSPHAGSANGSAESGRQLPNGSVLLGAVKETPCVAFDLPEQALGGEGRFVLYSLPYREVVSVSKPVSLE